MSISSKLACVCAASMLLRAGGGLAAAQKAGEGGAELPLEEYSLEQLSDIAVTSVSRLPGRLASAPASVCVISGLDIARSGATTLPEALRLAPNLQVALAGTQEYAISARGLSSRMAIELPVLVDGRSVYSPLFSGVYREAQDVVPADIDRIEVISAPGGTIRGANALNGLPQPEVPGYHELDARIARQARPDVELALAGRNLLQFRHPECGAAGPRQLAERGAFATVSLRC